MALIFDVKFTPCAFFLYMNKEKNLTCALKKNQYFLQTKQSNQKYRNKRHIGNFSLIDYMYQLT